MRTKKIIWLGVAALSVFYNWASAQETVALEKKGEAWHLLVNGLPFQIKGIGIIQSGNPHLSKTERETDYLLMAKEMGANSIRTWTAVPRSYLDQAQKDGLKVCAGIWLNPPRPKSQISYQDPSYRWAQENAVSIYVKKMKDHPAILGWVVGNEIFAYSKNKDEEWRLGQLYAGMVKKIHALDPNHPVIYAAGTLKDIETVLNYAPDIDVIGYNAYSDISPVSNWLKEHSIDKPLLLTEFGAVGSWDRPKDQNGVPLDQFDQEKADQYAVRWRQIEQSANCLGGFAFTLGVQRNKSSLTWHNINYGSLKKEAYWTLYELYTGKKRPFDLPKITAFGLEQNSGLTGGQKVRANFKVEYAQPATLTYQFFITNLDDDPILLTPPKFYSSKFAQDSSHSFTFEIPKHRGIYRVYLSVSDPHGNTALANQSLGVGAIKP